MYKVFTVSTGWLVTRLATLKENKESIVEMLFYQLLTSTVHCLLSLMCYDREMRMRMYYNEERILIVETEKTEEAIGKLVPLHILEGIKSDKKIIDHLEHVTIMFARLRCRNSSNNSLNFSHEYASLVQTLFGKFDTLCEVYQVYKVHSFGDIYVVMSYNGKVPKDERYTNNLINEANNTIKMACDMLDSVAY